MICGKCHTGELTTYASRPFPLNQGIIEYKRCSFCDTRSKYHVTPATKITRGETECQQCANGDFQHYVKYTTKPHPDQNFSIEYKECPDCGSKRKFYSSFAGHRSYEEDQVDLVRVTTAMMIQPGFSETVTKMLNKQPID